MSVDVSAVVNALDTYALDRLDCMGEGLAERARSNAPVDTGALAASIEWTGASGGGGNVTGTVTVGVDYGVYVNSGRGGEHGLLALHVGGEIIVVTDVGPAAPEPFWDNAIDAWPEITEGCGA